MNNSESSVDTTELERINLRIAEEEQRRDAGSLQFFATVLCEALIFRRANGTVVGKQEFIAGLQNPNPFTQREVEDMKIWLIGDRALVTLIVRTRTQDGTEGRYRNIRVAFRIGNTWQLGVWYNYDVTSL
jgi:Domain of unknown function (DUF4440)